MSPFPFHPSLGGCGLALPALARSGPNPPRPRTPLGDAAVRMDVQADSRSHMRYGLLRDSTVTPRTPRKPARIDVRALAIHERDQHIRRWRCGGGVSGRSVQNRDVLPAAPMDGFTAVRHETPPPQRQRPVTRQIVHERDARGVSRAGCKTAASRTTGPDPSCAPARRRNVRRCAGGAATDTPQ
jgi:hypothetical protein